MYGVSANYLKAVRGSHQQTVVCDAWFGGSPVPGGADIRINGGTVTDSSTPGVRRQLDIELLPRGGLFDLLSPTGTELRVRSVLRYPSGGTESVPMGVFDIDSTAIGYGPGGTITVSGDDKWVRVQRAKFVRPKQSWSGLTVVGQITALVREALGPAEQVIVNTSSTATVGTLVWEQDRDKAIIELAQSIGCWVYFNRDGVCTIAPLPVGNPPAAVWSVDAGATGVLLDANRSRDRSKTYNVVVVSSEKADGVPPFDPVIVWDNDSSSPTYAGSDPVVGTGAGPFGVVPYFWSSPVMQHPSAAEVAGLAMLTSLRGLNAQLALTSVRNHALDALDSIAVTLPPETYGAPTVIERHFIDRVTHPLMPDGTQTIDTRSTKVDVA